MKKLASVLLAISLLFVSNISVKASAVDQYDLFNDKECIQDIDVVIASALKLNSNLSKKDILTANTVVDKIIPLYDEYKNQVACYITYSPTGYSVVNNNPLNPEVIEFGRGKSELIEEALSHTGFVIYNQPFDVYSSSFKNTKNNVAQGENKSLVQIYPDLLTPNNSIVREIDAVKQSIGASTKSIITGDGYGFYDWGDLPGGSASIDTISLAGSVDWITTGEVDDIANDHCGATAVTNIALYYAKRGYSNLKISSNRDTFIAVHNIVGNGPVMTIADKAKTYFSNRGYNLGYSSVGTYNDIKTAVNNNQILGILLADGIVSWHWILGVGYRDYSSGENFIQIVNGWDDTIYKYYKPHSGSLWISTTKYWVN